MFCQVIRTVKDSSLDLTYRITIFLPSIVPISVPGSWNDPSLHNLPSRGMTSATLSQRRNTDSDPPVIRPVYLGRPDANRIVSTIYNGVVLCLSMVISPPYMRVEVCLTINSHSSNVRLPTSTSTHTSLPKFPSYCPPFFLIWNVKIKKELPR